MANSTAEILSHCTAHTRRLLAVSVDLAQQRDDGPPTADDVLDALTWFHSCVALEVLKQLGVFLKLLRCEPSVSTERGTPDPSLLGKELANLLQVALDEAQQLNHDYCGTEHVLLALLAARGTAAASFLQEHGVTIESARSAIVELLGDSSSGS